VRFARVITAGPAWCLMSSPARRARRPSTASRAGASSNECDLGVGGLWAVTFGPSSEELYSHDHIFGVIEADSRR
jgi:hypothetical protein